MPNLELLTRKISSARDLQNVVESMKAIAAASIRHYDEAAESIATYREIVEMGLRVALDDVGIRQDESGERKDSPLAAIVFGSAQGMCGQFNEDIASHAIDKLQHSGTERSKISVVASGERIAALMQAAGFDVQRKVEVPLSVSAITFGVQQILAILDPHHEQRLPARVRLFHNTRRSGSTYRSHQLDLLPFDRQWLYDLKQKQWPSRCLPTFFLDFPTLISGLTRQHLFVKIYQAFADSLAAENASRLAAMQAAESNIEDHLHELQSTHNHLRQNSITAEILDISAGYEALSKKES